MRALLFVLPLFVVVHSSFINPYPHFARHSDDDDPGEPLFLTPLIEANKIEEAQNLAEVKDKPFDWLKSYAGYLTVNKQYNSNMFFWYFASDIDPDHAPIVLWLQGGPGASSLFGLFMENGPFSVSEDGSLSPRKYSWSANHNLIYIDNPVGAGFSFTEHEDGYAKNEKDVGSDLYEAVKQLFQLFPQFQTMKFYVTGESYAGKYVPALAYKIHKKQDMYRRHGKVNPVPIMLAGIAIGNGLSDPIHQLKYGDYLYQIGLIDINALKIFHEYEEVGINCIKRHNMSCAFDTFDALINMDQLPQGSLFHNFTGFETYFNYLRTKGADSSAMGKFLQAGKTRKSIHVGNMTFHDLEGENKVEEHLKNDVMDTVGPWIAELLSFYRVYIYNGQLDIIVAYPLTLNYLQRLKFHGADIYKTASRKIWYVDDEIAGYTKEAGNLVEVLVRNAGHMAPADQPKWVFDLLNRLTNNKGFSKK